MTEYSSNPRVRVWPSDSTHAESIVETETVWLDLPDIGNVEVERDENGDYIVSDDKSLCYGVGDTLEKAIADYATSLIELVDLSNE